MKKPFTSKPSNDRSHFQKPAGKPAAATKHMNREEYLKATYPWQNRDHDPVPPHSDKDYRIDEEATQLYGWHTVLEACRNPARNFRKLYATENAQAKLTAEGVRLPSDIISVHPRILDHLLGKDAVHQGLYLECDPLGFPAVEKLKEGIVIVLDQVTDPHNVGAILRSASAFDVKAIVTTNRHSPETTGVLAKAASGALEHVPMVLVQNLNRALATLKENGFMLVGLDSEGENDFKNTELKMPLVLVLGAEGKGLRQSTKESCDILARIDLPGKIKSLNVSNAAALCLQAALWKQGS